MSGSQGRARRRQRGWRWVERRLERKRGSEGGERGKGVARKGRGRRR